MSATAPPVTPDAAPILVYDGACGFCTRAVQFVLTHDRRQQTLRFAARDGVAGRAVRERHPELAAVDSLLWVEWRDGAERVRVYADATLATAKYLGGGYGLLASLAAIVPRPIRDAAYRVVARYRKRLLQGAPACRLPRPDESARMLP